MNALELQACRTLMRGGSKSFYLSSLALPQRVRAPASALYAFCRVADDAIDTSAEPAVALADLHARLDAVYADAPRAEVADRALAAVVREAQLPRVLLDALLEGFAWDAQGRTYETIGDLHAYAARVAGTVGAMMALVMETRDAQSLARACELGVAMQLTNIARDVGEDARNGRLYLPRAWLREAGLDADAWLAAPRFDARLSSVIARLLAEAERLYARAECGVIGLPRRLPAGDPRGASCLCRDRPCARSRRAGFGAASHRRADGPQARAAVARLRRAAQGAGASDRCRRRERAAARRALPGRCRGHRAVAGPHVLSAHAAHARSVRAAGSAPARRDMTHPRSAFERPA